MEQLWKWTKRILKWLTGTLVTIALLITMGLYFFKDEIINYAIGEINQYLKVRVDVGSVDLTFWKTFPDLSIDFKHVYVQDALPESKSTDTLLYTEKIRLRFNPIDIWKENYNVKRIDVAPGTLNLKVNKAGEVNYDILKPSENKEQSAFKLQLKKIGVSELEFKYHNQKLNQLYSAKIHEAHFSGNFSDKAFTMRTDAGFKIHRIQNGLIPFVLNQSATTSVDIKIDKIKNTISLPNGIVNLAGLPFKVKLLVDSSSLHLKLQAKQLALTDVANKLAFKEVDNIEKFKGSGTASFDLQLDSQLGPEAFPFVDCKFNINNGKLTEPTQGLVLSTINLDGNYSTLKGKGKEELRLKNISFNTFSGPFKGNLKINQFNQPIYTGNASGSIDLATIHALFKIPKMDKISGKVGVDAQFQLMTEITPVGNFVYVNEGGGSTDLRNVQFQMEKDSRNFTGINGLLVLNRHQAALENLQVRLGNSDLKLNGIFDQIEGFLQDKNDLLVEVTADSKKVDLADFTNQVVIESNEVKLTDWLLPNHINGDVTLDVGTIVLDAHRFNNIHGNMAVGNRTITINQLTGSNAEATVSGALTVQETAPEHFELATSLSSNNIYFKPLFKEWNNFDQQVITADNISGKAEVLLDFKAPFNVGTGIEKEKILAQIQLKIVNGNLKNVSTFKQLTADLKNPKTRLILKPNEVAALEGKLENITFATLENTIYIKNSTIIIPKMEIKSTAIDITTEGTHTFNNMIDYKFSFRLRDLKLQKDESEFGEVIDDETGMRVYVRMHGTLDKPIIEWDKNSRKEQARENREAAKQEAISILKSEFGLFKNDTTIKAYQPKVQQREELRIEFGKEETVDPIELKKEKEKKQTKLSKFGEKLKQENQKEKDVEFTID